MNFVLTPLRFLLAAEADPSLLDLEDNYANRVDTLLYCVVQVSEARWEVFPFPLPSFLRFCFPFHPSSARRSRW